MDICLCTSCHMNVPFHYRLHHLDVGYCRLSLDGDYVMPMGGRWPRDAGRPWPRLIATTAVYSLQPLSITNRLRSSFPWVLDTRNNDTMYACVPHYDQSGSGGVPFSGGFTSFQVKMATLSILAESLNWCLVTCVIWQLYIHPVGWSNFLGIVKQCIFRQILGVHFGFVEFETQGRKEHIGKRLVWRCRPMKDSTGYFCWQHPESKTK